MRNGTEAIPYVNGRRPATCRRERRPPVPGLSKGGVPAKTGDARAGGTVKPRRCGVWPWSLRVQKNTANPARRCTQHGQVPLGSVPEVTFRLFPCAGLAVPPGSMRTPEGRDGLKPTVQPVPATRNGRNCGLAAATQIQAPDRGRRKTAVGRERSSDQSRLPLGRGCP